jgi:hypothetical protein
MWAERFNLSPAPFLDRKGGEVLSSPMRGNGELRWVNVCLYKTIIFLDNGFII